MQQPERHVQPGHSPGREVLSYGKNKRIMLVNIFSKLSISVQKSNIIRLFGKNAFIKIMLFKLVSLVLLFTMSLREQLACS
jgi:hypothetical protein